MLQQRFMLTLQRKQVKFLNNSQDLKYIEGHHYLAVKFRYNEISGQFLLVMAEPT